MSIPHLLPYSASKFALVGLSEGLRAELRKDGILVTTVVPGLMRTGSPRQAEVKEPNMVVGAFNSGAKNRRSLSSMNFLRVTLFYWGG